MSAASLYPVRPEVAASTLTDEATYKAMYQQSVVNPEGFWREQGKRIEVEDITLSEDETRALLFHSSERVWRDNTRGRYHVIDLATRRITPASTKPGLQMFAKLSPDARRVAFVRGNNLFVTDLAPLPETDPAHASESHDYH